MLILAVVCPFFKALASQSYSGADGQCVRDRYSSNDLSGHGE
jgi:hypothetical protein